MITPQQILNPQVKPKWQLPVGVMESVVAYNCRKYGMPRPVLAMPMWEGAGNRAIDLSGHGNHGDLINEPKWTSRGLDFDGSNDYVDVEDSVSLDITNALTISVLIKVDSITAAEPQTILRKYYTSFENYNFELTTAGNLRFIYYNSTWEVIDSLYTIPDTNYHNLVVVFNYSTLNVYFYDNGSLVSTKAITKNLVTNNFHVTIGAGSGGNFLNGIIDNVHIYNCALSAAQVKFLHDNPYFMYEIPEELYGYVSAVAAEANPYWYYQMLKRRN